MQTCRAIANGRGAPGQILLDGPHLVEAALAAGLKLTAVLHDSRESTLAGRLTAAGIPATAATADVIDAASPVRQPAGIVAIAEWLPRSATSLIEAAAGPIVAMIDVQDPGNVGSIIRSSDALGAEAVLALGNTAAPAGWKALRAAMGSTFRLPIGTGGISEVLDAAAAHRLPTVAAVVRNGVIIYEWSPPDRFLLLVGHEGSGLPQPVVARADLRVTIPMRPGIDSLNVGIGTALVLSEARRGRRASHEIGPVR